MSGQAKFDPHKSTAGNNHKKKAYPKLDMPVELYLYNFKQLL
ncbi:hypothetical protein SAMN03003324_02957 [Pedobacter antarcticus]|uniref:Uncharacterized protein n=1 Tax=Pedobacter antarcticus TaxID=34086 RepID=A0A1I2H3L8_9SPHI|nr:hypothetical protein SAMN03003324_02957 [Pedobacter antarcticus]